MLICMIGGSRRMLQRLKYIVTAVLNFLKVYVVVKMLIDT